MTHPKPVVLCILDGWGISDRPEQSAPDVAHVPNFRRLMARDPNATLITHGPDVGLPSGQMGNSEVGHTNIGAGRVVAMDLGQIDLAIEDGSFFDNPTMRAFVERIKAAGELEDRRTGADLDEKLRQAGILPGQSSADDVLARLTAPKTDQLGQTLRTEQRDDSKTQDN